MLSAKELELVTNPNIILTKNAIIGKVYDLFGQLSEQYKEQLQTTDLGHLHPKIARGENYQGLPWVMLDYPRRFLKTDTLAIRSFFWWGHFFSITLQIAGTTKDRMLPQLLVSLATEDWTDWYIGIGIDEWRHDFEPDNYVPITNIDWRTELPKQTVIKLATKIPLQAWDNLSDFYIKNFKQLMVLTSQAVK
jgi:hypothetical protein